MLSVLVIDSDPAVRALAKQILASAGVLCIMGDDPAETARMVRLNEPAAVLLQIGAALEGIDVARAVKTERPETRVVLVTSRDEEAFLGSTGKTGADALVAKKALQHELVPTLRRLDGVTFGRLWDGTERRRVFRLAEQRRGRDRRRPWSPRPDEDRHGSG